MTVPTSTLSLERHNSLRAQFTAVIFALAFLPNLSLTLIVGGGVWNNSLSFWTVGVAGLSGMIGYFLSGAMLEPLTRLRDEVERDDVSFQEPSGDPSEVRALRRAFSAMLRHLSTEQARRGAFMATLVHDLKTPLIATGHLAKLMMGEALSLTERREVGVQLLAETDRLLSLVQQMADAHRFEREEVHLHCRPTDLRLLLEAVMTRLAPRAVERGIALSVTGQGQAEVDAAVLERALSNLVDNALRYATSQVELSIERSEQRGHNEIQLSVTDDGPGLSGDLETLAQPFNAQPTTIAGQQYTAGTAGLGLFIAKRIAEEHGGQLIYQRRYLNHPLLPSRSPSVPGITADRSPSHHEVLSTFAQGYSVLTLSIPEVL